MTPPEAAPSAIGVHDPQAWRAGLNAGLPTLFGIAAWGLVIGIAMLESQMAATPDLAPKFGRALVRGTRFASDPANKEASLAHCAAGNPQEGEQDYAPTLYDGVVNRITPTEAFIGEGYGFQPPEHWQAIHDSAVAAGALEAALPDLSAVYTNAFVAGWNA